MSEMIERVAKRLHEKLSEQDINGYLAANFDLHAVARAAIEAMREPTEDLHAAAEDISVYYDDFSCGDGNITLGLPSYRAKFSEIWTQLIDAALATTPKES